MASRVMRKEASAVAEFIVCYDITDPKRLGRVYRQLCKEAMPLQYSVFLFKGDSRQVKKLMHDLSSLIDKRRDDVRAYPLPQRGLKARLGKPALPEGIQWGGMPVQW